MASVLDRPRFLTDQQASGGWFYTLKKKFDFHKYAILGACNPSFAYKAVQAEPHIGTMLPCNVIIQELVDGKVEVAAVDPLASMQSIQNQDLQAIAKGIQLKLKRVINQL